MRRKSRSTLTIAETDTPIKHNRSLYWRGTCTSVYYDKLTDHSDKSHQYGKLTISNSRHISVRNLLHKDPYSRFLELSENE